MTVSNFRAKTEEKRVRSGFGYIRVFWKRSFQAKHESLTLPQLKNRPQRKIERFSFNFSSEISWNNVTVVIVLNVEDIYDA